ncbi:MAG: flagellar hook-length control protein FliK [Planctomycetaceae bacterium]|jgi:hypothetical protein|nr:flagellar hook-length control protein FliK [Planctomycetaceae bacterium]
MPIDAATIYQNIPQTKQGQSTETPNPEMLKSVFVAAIQNSLTNRMFHSNTSIVDISVEIQDSGTEQKEQQNKDQHELLTQSERRDFTKEDKRTLNQLEIRHEQIADDYNRKAEQHDHLQTEYKEKKERRDFTNNPTINSATISLEKTVSSVPVSTGVSMVPTDSVSATLSVLPELSNQQNTTTLQKSVSVPITPGIIPPSFLVTGSQPVSVTQTPTTTQPFTALTTSSAPVVTLDAVSVMTIFTASGRFGIRKDETEEKNVIEKKKEKEKKRIPSLFVSGFVEMTPPVVYKNQSTYTPHDTEPESNNYSVQKINEENSQEPKSESESESELKSESKSESELKSELQSELKSRQESELDENRTKIPLEQWFSGNQSVEKSFAKPNESESFDPLRFIQRVAAACRSAANQQGTIRIKLHLDQLGTVTLQITSKLNKMAVRFEVTSFAAARRLRDTLGELHTTLAEQNIILEHTEIDMT